MAGRTFSLEEAVALATADDDDFTELELLDDPGADAPADQQEIPDSDSDGYSEAAELEDEDEDTEEIRDVDLGTGDNYPSKIAGFTWLSRPTAATRGRAAAANVIREQPGPTAIVPQVLDSPIDAFQLAFTPQMRDIVLLSTNAAYNEYCTANPEKTMVRRFGGYRAFTQEEIDAFIGLLFLQGVFKLFEIPRIRCDIAPLDHRYQFLFLNTTHDVRFNAAASKRTPNELWSELQAPHFRATMPRDRFQLLLMFCRFDDKNTRAARIGEDRFTHIRELWNLFNNRAQQLYRPGPYVTIDEQLVKFRGKCSFRQFMISKPGKYGIKIWILADAESFYCFNAIPYLGRQDADAGLGLGGRVVMQLSTPLFGSGRNITMDRYFTSINVAQDLLRHNLTMVGTVQPNRRGMPLALLPGAAKQREVGSTTVRFPRQLDRSILQSQEVKNRIDAFNPPSRYCH